MADISEGQLSARLNFFAHDGNAVSPSTVGAITVRFYQHEVSYSILPRYEAAAWADSEDGEYYAAVSVEATDYVHEGSVSWKAIRRKLRERANVRFAEDGAPEDTEVVLDPDSIEVYEVGPASIDENPMHPPSE